MKKNYSPIKTFIVLLCMITAQLGAQLSGTVTINAGAAASGTNFQTFNAFRTSLVTNGVNGPLTVNVVASSGPYSEQVSFPQVTGVSATNSITINGNGNTLTFSSSNSAQPWTFQMGGMDYMTVNNLNIYG